MSDMSIPITRTCTDITPTGRGNGSYGSRDGSGALSLSAFRETPAYVLLGDPGMGKTTELRRECEAMGGDALMLSARDFLTFDVADRPAWRGKTLVIDGLDETRVGGMDVRVPLDGVRRQIDRLGRPCFRISCREADWLGRNDWQHLKAVSPDSEVAVLRLDPMDEPSTRELLAAVVGDRDVDAFTHRARRRGVDAMLSNPLTLTLLAEIVAHAGRWPDSRRETFELACSEMADEHNPEHLAAVAGIDAASRFPDVPTLMEAAGYLCCLVLLSDTVLDHDLIRRHPVRPCRSPLSGDDTALDRPPNATAVITPHVLRCVLATKLFTAVGGGTFEPRHRQIAEFLAGRHLAELINGGLPARRVIALMTSPSDGGVPTSLRGLSAWLAAHSSRARRDLIGLDPVGVGLYGDIRAFTPDDRKRLLNALDVFSTQASLLGHGYDYTSGGAHGVTTVRAFRSLVTPDTMPTIENLLSRGENSQERAPELPCDITAENYRRRRGDRRLKDFLVRILAESD